jgi:glycosidase
LRGGTGVTSVAEGAPFQITAYAPSFTTPAWLQGAVVYSIFPDRFRNGDPSNDYCRAGSATGCPIFYGDVGARAHATWNEPVEDPGSAGGAWNRDFFGGDLQGVAEKLDYLKSLGVDAIWLNPIFVARSNHRYDTENYLHVDPALDGDTAFASLAAAAKSRGIRLILDGVFNHASSDSVYFDRYHRYSGGRRVRVGVVIVAWLVQDQRRDAVLERRLRRLGEHRHAAGLRARERRRQKLLLRRPRRGCEALARRGCEAWRLDAAQEIDHSWWREFRSAVKGYAADAPLIGEVTAGPTDARDYLLGNELDGVMNYRFRADADGFVRTDSDQGIPALTPSRLDHALTAMREEYPEQASAV